jgi:hypothetical protein
LIRGELGVDGEISLSYDAFIGTDGAEVFAIEDVGTFLDLQTYYSGLGERGDQGSEKRFLQHDVSYSNFFPPM